MDNKVKGIIMVWTCSLIGERRNDCRTFEGNLPPFLNMFLPAFFVVFFTFKNLFLEGERRKFTVLFLYTANAIITVIQASVFCGSKIR
jgi:hypothetical protein